MNLVKLKSILWYIMAGVLIVELFFERGSNIRMGLLIFRIICFNWRYNY
jgi:hypothetical protein